MVLPQVHQGHSSQPMPLRRQSIGRELVLARSFPSLLRMSDNENRTQTCRSEEDVRALASTAPERRHVHPARVNNLVMRVPSRCTILSTDTTTSYSAPDGKRSAAASGSYVAFSPAVQFIKLRVLLSADLERSPFRCSGYALIARTKSSMDAASRA